MCAFRHTTLLMDGLSLLARHSKHSYDFIFVTRLIPSLLPCSLIMSYTFSLLHPTFIHLLPFNLFYPPNYGINILAILLVLLSSTLSPNTVLAFLPSLYLLLCFFGTVKSVRMRIPNAPPWDLPSRLASFFWLPIFIFDFGLMRASSKKYLPQKGAPRAVTSVDGFNAYLLIADAKTRHTFVFLTVSKAPPRQILDQFLAKHGLNTGSHFLCMDQGGELWRSALIRVVAAQHSYAIEPTGSDSANQNGKVERLNGTFGVMVRALLYSPGLRPYFWSVALLHAVYLKNRLYHRSIKTTPIFAWTGLLPNLAHLRISFGSLITARQPGKAHAKLDRHTATGIFTGYGSTTRHIKYYDLATERFKWAITSFLMKLISVLQLVRLVLNCYLILDLIISQSILLHRYRLPAMLLNRRRPKSNLASLLSPATSLCH
jgi:hypothetical protein